MSISWQYFDLCACPAGRINRKMDRSPETTDEDMKEGFCENIEADWNPPHLKISCSIDHFSGERFSATANRCHMTTQTG